VYHCTSSYVLYTFALNLDPVLDDYTIHHSDNYKQVIVIGIEHKKLNCTHCSHLYMQPVGEHQIQCCGKEKWLILGTDENCMLCKKEDDI
jgi:rubredoxin